MTDYILKISLQSPLTSAAGEGRVGLVDRDIAFDDMGFPILPGRRLKGLWREAYRDVADAWQQCGQPITSAEQIFGSSGQKPRDGGACLHVANAELKEVSVLKEWLRYLQHPKIQKLHPDNVVGHYATVRTQTAIDRRTGSAKENTLRLTRTLKSGLVFWAPIRFIEPPNLALQNALALGAAALQHMGTARTRGLGKVHCRLFRLEDGNLTALTPDLNQSSLPSIADADTIRPIKQSVVQTPSVASSSPETCPYVFPYVLRYRLTLTAPAVIPVADGDPNTVVTRHNIPGSHLWGVAAWHYLEQANHTPEDPAFRHAFLDGDLRFLTAYPEASDTQQCLIPIPHSIRKFKDSEDLIERVEESAGERQTRRIDHRYARMRPEVPEVLETQAVKIERNYHHARALNNRKIGRALGAEVPNGGALFKYEAICSGQSFQGAVLGSESDLKNLQMWLPTQSMVSVGRSRSAQYGAAKFEWIVDVPEKLNGLVEQDGFGTQQAPPNLGERLIITALSPLLAVNEHGHPEARFPKQELAKILGLDTSKLTLSASYTRTEIISGYHTHLRLPRQQQHAIDAGSVFVFKLPQTLDENALVKLEQDGLGLRKGEGYGRIAVNRHGHFNLQTEKHLDNPEDANVPNAPESEVPPDLLELLRGILRTRCMAEIQETAGTIAKRIENFPRNSLLGRLRLFLQEDPTIAVERLANLRKPAKDALTNCEINARQSGIPWLPNTLYALFEKTWTDPNTLTEDIIKKHASDLLTANTCQILIDQLVEGDQKAICRVFLDHLLTVLYRPSEIQSEDATEKN